MHDGYPRNEENS
jgi:hypothetical protein